MNSCFCFLWSSFPFGSGSAPLHPATAATPSAHVQTRRAQLKEASPFSLHKNHHGKKNRVSSRTTDMNWCAEGLNYHQSQQKRKSKSRQWKNIPFALQKHSRLAQALSNFLTSCITAIFFYLFFCVLLKAEKSVEDLEHFRHCTSHCRSLPHTYMIESPSKTNQYSSLSSITTSHFMFWVYLGISPC